jgi:hypothetical protein
MAVVIFRPASSDAGRAMCGGHFGGGRSCGFDGGNQIAVETFTFFGWTDWGSRLLALWGEARANQAARGRGRSSSWVCAAESCWPSRSLGNRRFPASPGSSRLFLALLVLAVAAEPWSRLGKNLAVAISLFGKQLRCTCFSFRSLL